jgi:glycosyltransferase involved in cell wall biosynthesis
MAIYPVRHPNGLTKVSYERSPKIRLETDLATAEELPQNVRDAADLVVVENLDTLRTGKLPRELDGVITWLAGERLLEGSAASIRQNLRIPGRRCLVPVHYPCLPELDLLTLQPRWQSAGPAQDYCPPNTRIAGASQLSPSVLAVLKTIRRPWSQLLQAVLAELEKLGAGLDPLAGLANDTTLPRAISALALRNLLVLLIRHKDLNQAEQLLQLGRRTYPDYTELAYIGAILCFHQNKPAKAFPYLEKAKSLDRELVGSGSQSLLRAAWLHGVLATRVGNQRVAFEHFLPGMLSRPALVPAVEQLLNLRLPPAVVEKHQWDFCRLVRREPQFLDAVFDYLLLHRAFAAARRIAETVPESEEKRNALRQKLATAEAPFLPGPVLAEDKPGVMLNGSFFEHSSLARINRELGAALVESTDLDACLEPVAYTSLPGERLPHGELLAPALLRHPRHLQLTIRHSWPPDFSRPSRGKLAVIVPWEYGAVPQVWSRQIEQNVDELWVPSTFVRDVFVRAGVGAQRIQVIPNGIDPRVFSPEGETSRPHGCRKYMFLFVGGAIRRKGIDVLLEAYKTAFDAGDDVTLVVSTGVNPAYSHNSMNGLLAEFAHHPRNPHLQTMAEQYDDTTMAALYRSCDAFVLPYRGEGFGMPNVEAMACGRPIITTEQGPSQDYCSPQTAYLIPAKQTTVPDDPPALGELSGEFTWFEPDVTELARTMLHVYRNPSEATQRGRAAAKAVRQKFAWSRITQLYLSRVKQLAREETSTETACQESVVASA